MSDDFKSKTDIEQEIDDFLRQFEEQERQNAFRSSSQNDTRIVEDRFNKISDNFDRNFRKVMPDKDAPGVHRAAGSEKKPPPVQSRMNRYHSDQTQGSQSFGYNRTQEPAQNRNVSSYNRPPEPGTQPRDRSASEMPAKKQKEEPKGFFQKLHGAVISVLVSLRILKEPAYAETSESGAENHMSNTNKKTKKHKFSFWKLFKIMIILGLVLSVLLGGFVIYVVATTPPIDPDKLYDMLSENSILYDDQGAVVDSLYINGGKRTNVNYSQLPPDLVNAIVAIEDKTFWKHHGFNFVRIFGAILEGVTQGERIGGTSTLTQQLARNLYLAESKNTRTLTRKIKEAYYTVQLEQKLSKKQILEAYLNTIYLGSQSNGVQAASQAYFSKDVGDLNLAECAVVAALPQLPNTYAPVKQDKNELVNTDGLDILNKGDVYTMWYNDAFIPRQRTILKFMKEQEYITQSEYDEALAYNIRDSIKPSLDNNNDISSYFADYTIKQVISDLMEEQNLTEDEARVKVYNGGLRIYSTMNVKMQQIAENEFAQTTDFPKVTSLNKDAAGNVRGKNNGILLYNEETFFNSDQSFTLKSDEYRTNSDGSMTLLKGKRLNFYNTVSQGKADINVEFKPLYTLEDGIFFSVDGVIQIDSEYKQKDSSGNLTISSAFFDKYPNFFRFTGDGATTTSDHYVMMQKVMQPQAAMVIMDHKTGGIKAMVGGRSLEGRLLYNRATDATRQPGSSIKPMAVYAPALQSAVDGQSDWTAASIIEDSPIKVNGKSWPKNWYNGFKGSMPMRKAVEQSVNTISVKVWQDIGVSKSVDFLKKLGVTTVKESGSVNDMNAAALALGGMSKGISPLEMCAGYSAFANRGVYNEPTCYTKVTNKQGDVLLEAEPNSKQVMDEGVAFIITDMLRTTVTNGIAKGAAIGSQPVAGKTGTTTDNYDAWFVGYTPQYTASMWIGNDVNIELSKGSVSAAKIWSKIMKQVCNGIPAGTFPKAPNVVSVTVDSRSGKLASESSRLNGTADSEYFVKGTEPTAVDNTAHTSVKVCEDSDKLATPWCPNTIQRSTKDESEPIPTRYCSIHNQDTEKYPTTSDGDGTTTTKPPGTTGGGTTPGTGDGSHDTGTGGGTNTPPTTPTTPVTPPPSDGEGDSTRPEWLNWN